MEVVEGHKVTFQETREQTKVHLDPTRLYKWKVSSRWADFRWSVFFFFSRCSPRQRTGTRARWPQGWSCSDACSQKSPGSSSPPGKSENNCNGFPARRKKNKTKSQKYCFYLSFAHICKRKEHHVWSDNSKLLLSSISFKCVQSFKICRSVLVRLLQSNS